MRTLSGASAWRRPPLIVTSRAKAAISSALRDANAGSANGARASSPGDGGRRSSSVAWPRIAIEFSEPDTTTPTAGDFASTLALSVPRPMPNQSRSGVAANRSGVTCGPADVSTARYATDAWASTLTTSGLNSPFIDRTLMGAGFPAWLRKRSSRRS